MSMFSIFKKKPKEDKKLDIRRNTRSESYISAPYHDPYSPHSEIFSTLTYDPVPYKSDNCDNSTSYSSDNNSSSPASSD